MRENSVKCIKNAPLSRRNIKSFSGSVPILECQKVGLIKDQFQFQIQFFCLSRVSVTRLSNQSILVDKDDLVHGRRRQGASSGFHNQTSHREDPLGQTACCRYGQDDSRQHR